MTRRIPPPPSQCGVVTVVDKPGPMVLVASRGECAQQSQPLVELSDLMLPVCLLGGFPAPWGGWQHAFGIVLRNETHV